MIPSYLLSSKNPDCTYLAFTQLPSSPQLTTNRPSSSAFNRSPPHKPLIQPQKSIVMAPRELHRVAIIGSGNWSVAYSYLIPHQDHWSKSLPYPFRVGNCLGYRGSAIAKIAAENTARHSDLFQKEVPMWVYEEQVRSTLLKVNPMWSRLLKLKPVCLVSTQVDGQNLTTIINEKHENVKYLPGVQVS